MSYTINITEQTVEIFDGRSFYGAFYSTQDQTNATSVNKMTYNVTDIASGVSIVSNSRITIANAGIYNIQFSAQFDKTDSGDDKVDIWLSKNGSNVSNTNTETTLVGNNGKHVAAWNFVVAASAEDYFELCWYSADSQVFINYVAAASNPTRPAIPSVILTVTQI
jgi:hypothetical protein